MEGVASYTPEPTTFLGRVVLSPRNASHAASSGPPHGRPLCTFLVLRFTKLWSSVLGRGLGRSRTFLWCSRVHSTDHLNRGTREFGGSFGGSEFAMSVVPFRRDLLD